MRLKGDLLFVETLSSNGWRNLSRDDLVRIAEYIDSDGCSFSLDIHVRCCVVHDWFYETHINFDGSPISRSEADRVFRHCMQRKSVFRSLGPLAWWRWTAVRLLGGRAWDT